jgi:hypothetical protein
MRDWIDRLVARVIRVSPGHEIESLCERFAQMIEEAEERHEKTDRSSA